MVLSRRVLEMAASAAAARRPGALTYDDLPNEIKGAILDYLRFTNESLRAAVKGYFEDKAATERRYGEIGTWNVGRVTDMAELFYGGHKEFNEDTGRFPYDPRSEFNADISSWDTSSVTTMRGLFRGCRAFEGRGIGAWDTSSVTDMSWLFAGCLCFDAAIGAWATSSVTDMSKMFCGLDGRMKFNRDIGAWDTSSVTDMHQMFENCASFRGRGIGAWSTSSVTSVAYMFGDCHYIEEELVGGWDMTLATDRSKMFSRVEACNLRMIDTTGDLLWYEPVFTVQMTMRMGKLKRCMLKESARNRDPATFRFQLRGDIIEDDATPLTMGLEPGDLHRIDCLLV